MAPADRVAEDAVYSRFPTASVVVLVNETIGALRDGKQEALAAPSHVEHVLCTLGMAFALPWTHLEVTMGTARARAAAVFPLTFFFLRSCLQAVQDVGF